MKRPWRYTSTWFAVKHHFRRRVLDMVLTALVNIMDLIMFEAQRQGRLSFYMVPWIAVTSLPAADNY